MIITEEEETFADAAPLLFSKEFNKRDKEHLDTAKLLKPSRSYYSQSFWRDCPQCPRKVATSGANNKRDKRIEMYDVFFSKLIKNFKQYRLSMGMQGSTWARDHAYSSNTRGVNKNKANICPEGARDCTHKHSSDRDFTYPSGDRALTYAIQDTRACTSNPSDRLCDRDVYPPHHAHPIKTPIHRDAGTGDLPNSCWHSQPSYSICRQDILIPIKL